jgi:hypothetical protein
LPGRDGGSRVLADISYMTSENGLYLGGCAVKLNHKKKIRKTKLKNVGVVIFQNIFYDKIY